MVTNTAAPHFGGASVGESTGMTVWVVNYRFGEFGPPHERVAPPRWARLGDEQSPDPFVAYGFGWPIRTLSLYTQNGPAVTHHRSFAIAAGGPSGREFHIPVGVLWWNLVLSSLLFALPISGLWVLAAARRRAARRGRCQSCGYPRTGLQPTAPCPECGLTPIAQR